MLWLLESGRPSINLRKHFFYQVIPLETVHVLKEEGLIEGFYYRPSKRTKLLKYEELLDEESIHLPRALVASDIDTQAVLENEKINIVQKRYILEAAIEYLEYQFSKGKIKKEKYLELFHLFTTERAKLGTTKALKIVTPPNPIASHRAIRTQIGAGVVENEVVSYLGVRLAYHDLEDSNYGFLRGTQIEFLDLLFSNSANDIQVENATILSIVSLAQRSEFFHSFSWRTNLGWDSDYTSDKATFNFDIGGGYSWGNEIAFVYFMIDPFLYVENRVVGGVGGSVGINVDKYKYMNTNVEVSQRFYDNGKNQLLLNAAQGIRISQNTQIVLKYDYKEKYNSRKKEKEESIRAMFKYYF